MKLRSISVLKVLKFVVGNPNVKIDYHPLPEDDPKTRRPDISLAKKLLNWEPKVDRKEGFKRNVQSILNRLCQSHKDFNIGTFFLTSLVFKLISAVKVLKNRIVLLQVVNRFRIFLCGIWVQLRGIRMLSSTCEFFRKKRIFEIIYSKFYPYSIHNLLLIFDIGKLSKTTLITITRHAPNMLRVIDSRGIPIPRRLLLPD